MDSVQFIYVNISKVALVEHKIEAAKYGSHGGFVTAASTPDAKGARRDLTTQDPRTLVTLQMALTFAPVVDIHHVMSARRLRDRGDASTGWK